MPASEVIVDMSNEEIPSADEYMPLVTNKVKDTRVRLELLDESYFVLDRLEGQIINMAMVVSSTSDIRRTATVTMYMPDAKSGNDMINYLWLNKMIRMYFGIKDTRPSSTTRGQYIWFLMGSFMIGSNAYSFDLSSQQLQVSLVDMMASVTQERGSQIGYDTLIYGGDDTPNYHKGSTMKGAYTQTIARFSRFKRTNVCDFEPGYDIVPYDLETPIGAYPIDILHNLLGLYSWYEMFYDKYGVFVVRKVPTYTSEPCALQANHTHDIIISEQGNVDFAEIKNTTEVWGQELDAEFTAKEVTSSPGTGGLGNNYQLTISDNFEGLEAGATVSFTPDETNTAGQTITIALPEGSQDQGPYKIYVENGDYSYRELNAGELLPDKHYVVLYSEVINEEAIADPETGLDENGEVPLIKRFILQGLSFIHAMCMEYRVQPTEAEIEKLKRDHNCDDIRFTINAESPFAVDYMAENGAMGNGIIKQVLTGGDYANIYTTQLALERAAYENWKTTRLKDVIKVTTLLVPWLDVNQKIEYTSILTGETHQYLIQDININFVEFTMDMTLQRFYPLYPWYD